MALTPDQITDALLCLGLPVRTDVTFGLEAERDELRQAEVAMKALQLANATQETKVTAILAQWTPIQFETDTINAEGLDSNPVRARRQLKVLMARTLGLRVPRSGYSTARG